MDEHHGFRRSHVFLRLIIYSAYIYIFSFFLLFFFSSQVFYHKVISEPESLRKLGVSNQFCFHSQFIIRYLLLQRLISTLIPVIIVEVLAMSLVQDHTSKATLKLPVPGQSMETYSGARLRESLRFALKVLDRRQDMSPGVERFYSRFRDAITDALDAETGPERIARLMTVARMEHFIVDRHHLQPQKFGRSWEVRTALLELREMQYLARYGDYVNMGVGHVRIHAGASKLPGWECISGKYPWSDISRRLRAEEVALHRSGDQPWNGPYPTFLAISDGCWSMGYDFDFVRWSIHHYAKKKPTFQTGLECLIRCGGTSSALFHDLKDVWCVFSETRSQTQIEHLRAVIQNHIDLWFDSSCDRDKPDRWLPTEEFYDAWRKIVDRENEVYAQRAEEEDGDGDGDGEGEGEKYAERVALPWPEKTWSAEMVIWEKSRG